MDVEKIKGVILMQLQGIGTDIVEIERIRRVVTRFTDNFKNRIFTDVEWEYCWNKKNPIPSLAARFAAKEAVFKALGTGLSSCKWKDVEVSNDNNGKPEINLYGKAAEIASSHFISNVEISLSHCKNHAIAFAVAK